MQRLVSPNWIFYLWLPLTVGLFMSTTEASGTDTWPVALRTLYFVLICCLDWWLVDAGCRLCAALMRRWPTSFYAVLLIGSVVTSLAVVQPANWVFIQGWNALMPVQRALPPVTGWGLDGMLTDLVAGLAPWLIASVTFFRLGNTPRYGFSPPGLSAVRHGPGVTPAAAMPGPAFLGKVRPARRGDLLALNAQGHYLRVITAAGEDLVLYRFGDAVAELPAAAGLQVHRSWWVSEGAIADSEGITGRKLRLRNGVQVPVSRTYQRELQARLDADGRAAPDSG